ncbi:hypothetical protein AVEN_158054-1 [Araneus ventricosus]|uniref:Uncharacterized protein n=1 Tax=Araneus ventricosus TaxID=182803 RepID=A0A4Y2T1T0_ARAVE|nr:hypothetical protein AVEN_158054-1 [Araneus ventricosus]
MDQEGRLSQGKNQWNRKQKEGRPPSEELATCKKIQELDSRKILTRQLLRRERKRLKRYSPNSEAGIRAAKDVERYNEAMKIGNESLAGRVIRGSGLGSACTLVVSNLLQTKISIWVVLNCTKHPNTKNEDNRSEVDATSCTDMDTESMVDDQEQDNTPPEEGNNQEMVSPRKTARGIPPKKEATPIKTDNMYSQLGEQEIPKSAQKLTSRLRPTAT